MMKLSAVYYDGLRPVGESVVIYVETNGDVTIRGEELQYSCRWQEISISSPLGNTARKLQLPNGAQCQVTDLATLATLQNQFGKSGFGNLIHRLESHWYAVLIATLIVIGFSWVMIAYGIPATAKYVAYALPNEIDETLSKNTLNILDEYFLEDSCLKPEKKQAFRDRFEFMVAQSGDSHNYNLLFRSGMGANAFALPSGDIVVTDELIELSENNEEVLAVIAHEIGHVIHKHGLRSVLQSSAVALLLTAVTGDISTTSGFAAAIPILLLETSYSRRFEHEADQYAFDYMVEQNIDTKHFANILKRITGNDDIESEKSAFDYLSTHPVTSERVQKFIDHSQARSLGTATSQ